MADSQPIDDDGYLELLEDARSALYRLLQATEPGTGPGLHRAYNDLKDSIRHAEANAHQDAPSERESTWERENAWKLTPRERRESVLFQRCSATRG